MLAVLNPPMLAYVVTQKFVIRRQRTDVIRRIYSAFTFDHTMVFHCYDESYGRPYLH